MLTIAGATDLRAKGWEGEWGYNLTCPKSSLIVLRLLLRRYLSLSPADIFFFFFKHAIDDILTITLEATESRLNRSVGAPKCTINRFPNDDTRRRKYRLAYRSKGDI